MSLRPFAILRREDGSEVAVYSATEVDPQEIELTAWGPLGGGQSSA